MPVVVHLFAGLRDAVGAATFACDVDAAATLADVEAALAARHPSAAALAARSQWAVDGAYAPRSTPVRPDADTALIPPVSGG